MPTSLKADANGVVRGKFKIPPKVRAGTKLVQFKGTQGGNGDAMFTGQGTVVTNNMRKVTNVSQAYYDPLAQTFIADSARHLAAVEIWVTKKGNTPLIVQLRDTQVGFPTTTILAEGRLDPANIVEGAYNRVVFAEPFYSLPNTEYAVVVLCNDADMAVGISELGKPNLAGGGYVSSQPYQVGVLLSSANASTWTAHQDRDLTFRLLCRKYTQASKTMPLGTVSVNNATDFLVSMLSTVPATGADANFLLEFPNGTTQTVSDGQVIQNASAITGDIKVSAVVRSTPDGYASALLDPGSQLIAGSIASEGSYVSRAFAGDPQNPMTATVYLTAADANNATIEVYLAIDKNPSSSMVWTKLEQTGSTPGNQANMTDRKFTIKAGDTTAGVTTNGKLIAGAAVRLKVILKGGANKRVYVTNCRVSLV